MGDAKTGVMTAQPLTARTGGPLTGEARVPGDKSLSHRALIFGAMAVGETRVRGLLESADVAATAEALRQLGAQIERHDDGTWHIWGRGVGGFAEPASALDLGNSGTGARLLLGLAAQQPITAVFTGDTSLQSRPMARVMAPLEQMGARFECRAGGRLPLTLRGPRRPRPISYELPVPSAQVKSAILLAGLAAPGATTAVEPAPTRDHTERMARAFGAEISVSKENAARIIRLTGEVELAPTELEIAGDPSSAAFLTVAALITPGSDILLPGVLVNPARTGLFQTLKEMGGDISFSNERELAGEPVADMRVHASALKGIEVPPERAPSMIDEYPVLAVAAAYAQGETTMHGLAELRVKESDRLAAIAAGLEAIGVKADAGQESLAVSGGGGEVPGGGTVKTHRDHRIAMAFLVAGLAARAPVKVDDGTMIATSFPSFLQVMQSLGASIEGAGA